jgi:hypothetical protein
MFKRTSSNAVTTGMSNLISNLVSNQAASQPAANVASNQATSNVLASALTNQFASANLSQAISSGLLNTTTGSQLLNPNLINIQQINPSLLNNLGLLGPLITLPQANPPGMPDTLSPTELQILLNALPVAQEGYVITSAHINALRTAILNLAAKIGGAALSPTQLLTFMPAFAPSDGNPAWSLKDGVAKAGPNESGGSASGWLPLQLPDGMSIQAMIVLGDKTGTITSFNIELFKLTLDGSDPQPVITTALSRAADQFNVTTQASGTPPVIDNRSIGYFVTADVAFTGNTSQARIFAIQVICSQS